MLLGAALELSVEDLSKVEEQAGEQHGRSGALFPHIQPSSLFRVDSELTLILSRHSLARQIHKSNTQQTRFMLARGNVEYSIGLGRIW